MSRAIAKHPSPSGREQGEGVLRWALLFLLALAPARLFAADDVAELEEQAMKHAAAQVAPSVVRIETVGGLERVGAVLVGTGPTTGLIVDSDGYVVSSAFNFVQKPASILVVLPDGTRVPAEHVATDHSRMLVLLKIKTNVPLRVPVAAPASELAVGQWAIAVGRTFDGNQTNMSVGIVSALARIWGKAVQTDAKISPSNYGGPLVDLQGRVFGVLVPLSPQGDDEVAGVEWYDSGIGFAIPLEHILSVLPRLKKGEDLHPGILGVSMKRGDMYADPATIGTVRAKSPAFAAGIRAGDTIVEFDGQPVASHAQMKQQLAPHYAGDKVHVVALRGEQRLPFDVELAEKLPPYQHPFLGILPLRGTPADPAGVTVRFVYPDSPAAKAGLKPGDRIISLDGKPVKNRIALVEQISAFGPSQTAALELQRGDQTIKADVELATLPEAAPADRPPAQTKDQPADDEETQDKDKVDVGLIHVKIPEYQNECIAYIPESYAKSAPPGIVIWLHPPGGFKDQELVARWKQHCDEANLILLAPKSADPSKWQRTEVAFILKCLANIGSHYRVDPLRIVAYGQEGGASMAYLLAFRHREFIRAVATVDASIPRGTQLPENEPELRLAFYFMTTAKSGAAKQIQSDIDGLRKANFPVTVAPLGEDIRPLTDDDLSRLTDWIDTLDRI